MGSFCSTSIETNMIKIRSAYNKHNVETVRKLIIQYNYINSLDTHNNKLFLISCVENNIDMLRMFFNINKINFIPIDYILQGLKIACEKKNKDILCEFEKYISKYNIQIFGIDSTPNIKKCNIISLLMGPVKNIIKRSSILTWKNIMKNIYFEDITDDEFRYSSMYNYNKSYKNNKYLPIILQDMYKYSYEKYEVFDNLFVYACSNGYNAVVCNILSNIGSNLNINFDNNKAFRMACTNGHTNIVKMLLELKGNLSICVNVNNDEGFRKACENGHIEIVNMLLELTEELLVDANINDDECFRMACKNGHIKIVRKLLKLKNRHVNVHALNNYALTHASANNHIDVVNLLMNLDGKRKWSYNINMCSDNPTS
jgi:ankyrin repeat protein